MMTNELPASAPSAPVAPPTPVLSARERERAKTAKERGADWAYTINHTIVCFATDAMQVPLAAGGAALIRANMEKLGKAVNWLARNLGCGHLHFDASKPFWGQYKQALRSWFKGEVYGDLGAVPITLGTQYFFPGFMHSLSTGAEKVVGPLFRRGAEKDTAKWARLNGIAPGSAEYKAHADQLYDNEIKHLGQGIVWTVSSLPINFAVQLYDHDHHHGDDHAHPAAHAHAPRSWKVDPTHFRSKLLEFTGGKLVGTVATLGMVLTLRTQFPMALKSWDEWTNHYVFTPANQLAGSLIGSGSAKRNTASEAPGTTVTEAQPSQRVQTVTDATPAR